MQEGLLATVGPGKSKNTRTGPTKSCSLLPLMGPQTPPNRPQRAAGEQGTGGSSFTCSLLTRSHRALRACPKTSKASDAVALPVAQSSPCQ